MAIMEDESIKIVSAGAVSEVLVNRPQALNALNADVLQGLILTLDKLAKMNELRVLIEEHIHTDTEQVLGEF